MFLEINSRIVDGVVVVDVAGELSRRASALFTPIKQLLDQNHAHHVLNLSSVRYIDSSGIGQLITIWTSVGNRRGQVVLLQPPPRVREQLEMMKLDTVFTILNDEADAVQRVLKAIPPRS
ncbi:MAG TPA: STAS domain-containing protein [Terriglobia bacterium]|nr:STAS domain-containing protein [Terriglobia bacterium]